MEHTTMSWLTLLGLGAFHGINPGMGWLFAVALGLQERRRGAVVGALLPLGVGHGLAVGAAVVPALLLGVAVPSHALRWGVAGILIAFGISRLFRHRHPRWASMRVSRPGLTWWSFLMASAHGAGLMVVPVFLSVAAHAETGCHSGPVAHAPTTALLATSVHALGYLVVTAVIALVIFEKLGLGLLRKAWFNLDLIWAAALIGTGALTFVL